MIGTDFSLEPGDPRFHYLSGEVAPGWVIRRPMQVRIERDEMGAYVASNEYLSIYGVGPDRDVAIEEYIASLIEYYELIEREARDHEPTAYYLRRIRHFISRVRA